MRKHYLKALFFVMISALLVSCAVQKPLSPFTANDLNPRLQDTQYVQKVDTFLVILDASSSMARSHKEQVKLDIAKNLVNRMNQTIPDLKLTAGLRTFGQNICPFAKKTILIYGLTKYSRAEFEEALIPVKWAGLSPLASAINASTEDLKSAHGNIAVIIVSDGKKMDQTPVQAARKMKDQFGDRLCIYTVLAGDSSAGKSLLEQVARAGECGFSVNADQIYSSGDMADFVEKVFFRHIPDSDGDGVTDDKDQCPNTPSGVSVDSAGCPLDTDGDGVYDYMDKCLYTPKGVKVDSVGCPVDTDGDGTPDHMDKCPGTPKGVKVDIAGCPLDTDGDGVYDYLDKCPGTPIGARVDERGCWVLKGVYFDTNKYTIKSQSYSILDEVVIVLKKNPGLRVEIQGHTDNRGSGKYNQKLSENRAKAVMDYFMNAGIADGRLSAVGYGLSKPAVPNTSSENWAKNRRVELNPVR